jgi:hypothetical protein
MGYFSRQRRYHTALVVWRDKVPRAVLCVSIWGGYCHIGNVESSAETPYIPLFYIRLSSHLSPATEIGYRRFAFL